MKTRIALCFAVSILCGCASSSLSIFQNPATAVVNTQWVVVNKGFPVLVAFHNEEHDEWIFFADVNPSVDVQVSVALEELLKLDGTLKELSDLPAGWKATREKKGGPWKREKLAVSK